MTCGIGWLGLGGPTFAIPEMIDHGVSGYLVDTNRFDCETMFRGYMVNEIPEEFLRHVTGHGRPPGRRPDRVEDLDEARWALQQRGVVFQGHESEVPGVARFTTFHDPDGNLLQLIEYGPPGASPGSSARSSA